MFLYPDEMKLLYVPAFVDVLLLYRQTLRYDETVLVIAWKKTFAKNCVEVLRKPYCTFVYKNEYKNTEVGLCMGYVVLCLCCVVLGDIP